jgi:hypothetical protein
MKYILTLEAYYKKRGLIGKAVDWVKGRKDFNDLIEGQKQLGESNKVYSIDKDNLSNLSEVSDDVDGQSKVINWTKNNPGKILIFRLNSYNKYITPTFDSFRLIKFDILIKDILEVVDRRLEVLSIEIDRSYEYDEFRVKILLKEDGWQEGDGMPDDIYNDYIGMIRSGFKKKREDYIKEYNILQSQKKTVRFKHRSIRLYGVTTGYQSKYDNERGLLKIEIDPRM